MATHNHVWKRRIRNAPSAGRSDKEIILSIHWTTAGDGPALPTTAQRKDPLLWSIWTMKTNWMYMVRLKIERGGTEDAWEFKGEKDALAQYKHLVKDFPRSKDVDYGFPVDDTPG